MLILTSFGDKGHNKTWLDLTLVVSVGSEHGSPGSFLHKPTQDHGH